MAAILMERTLEPDVGLEQTMKILRNKGFTLLELMIVVIIIAILASLAFSSYAKYGFRARRTEGQSFLMQVAAAEERYFTTFNKYTGSITGASPGGLGFSANTSQTGYYSVAVSNLGASNTTYTLTATPAAVQATDKCLNLTIDNLGQKSYSGDTTNGNCW
jgi:type IV pilus assembly protein PilE